MECHNIKKSLDKLTRAITIASNERDKRRAESGLETFLNNRNVAELEKLLSFKYSDSVVKEIEFAIWSKKLDCDLDNLLHIIYSENDVRKKDTAILAIGDKGYTEAAGTLIELLGSSDVVIREAAAISISNIKLQKALKPLVSTIKANPNSSELLYGAFLALNCNEIVKFLIEQYANTNSIIIRYTIEQCFTEGAVTSITPSEKEYCLDILDRIKSETESDVQKLKSIIKEITVSKNGL